MKGFEQMDHKSGLHHSTILLINRKNNLTPSYESV